MSADWNGGPTMIEAVARFGYAARGVVYLIIGALAILAAFGAGGETTGTRGALRTLLAQPLGTVLLGLMACGLAAFALWRVVQAFADPDGNGRDTRGLMKRAGQLVGAAIHAALALFALSLLFGWGADAGGDDDAAARDWTAWLLAQPLGRWLVAAIGAGIIAAGLAHLGRCRRAHVAQRLDAGRAALAWIMPIARFGFVAHGFVLAMIGGFLIGAAVTANPNEVRGLAGALEALGAQPFGWLPLAIVALGLAAFGICGFVAACCRDVRDAILES